MNGCGSVVHLTLILSFFWEEIPHFGGKKPLCRKWLSKNTKKIFCYDGVNTWQDFLNHTTGISNFRVAEGHMPQPWTACCHYSMGDFPFPPMSCDYCEPSFLPPPTATTMYVILPPHSCFLSPIPPPPLSCKLPR